MKLEARGVGKYYLSKRAGIGCFYAVRGADLCILPGRVTALMGRSGSGKTTLMQMMAGLLKPDAGTVLLDGRNLSSCSDEELCALRRHHFGVVPQGADLLPQLTVMENLLLPLAMEGRGEEEIFFQRARNLLDRLGIADLEHVFAKDLSGGERRRVCIIRSLLPSPDFILADEPTSDLDEGNVRLILHLFKEAALEGKGVLVISHDQEVLSICDDLYCMDGGILTRQEGKKSY